MAIPDLLLQLQDPFPSTVALIIGDDLVIRIGYEDEDGTPLDFTGVTATAVFYDLERTQLFTVTGTISSGTITFTVTKAQTGVLSLTGLDEFGPGEFLLGSWDLELTDAETPSRKKTTERGQLTLRAD